MSAPETRSHSARIMNPTIDLIVLAGGRARRLGGALKPAVEVAGRTLLSRVLDARPLVRHVVVVGPDAARAAATPATANAHPADFSPVVWTLEDPPFGGPVAGIAAGLVALAARTETTGDTGTPGDTDTPGDSPADWILLLACDLPWATDAAPLLIEAACAPDLPPTVDGIHLVDETGHAQWLVAIFRGPGLAASVARLGAAVRGASMHALLGELELRGLADPAGTGHDVDTWQDVEDSTVIFQRDLPAATPQGGTP